MSSQGKCTVAFVNIQTGIQEFTTLRSSFQGYYTPPEASKFKT
jgi:hypothetical protein